MTNTPFTDEQCAYLLDHFAEQDRLRKPSNEELVKECLAIPDTDCAVVDEMMTRLWPGWFEEEE